MKITWLIIAIIIKLCYSINTEFEKTFCDRNLAGSKIQEFESCDKFIPKEILDNSNSCLKELNLGTSYVDFRNTICNDNQRKKYINCLNKRASAQKQAGAAAEMSQEEAEKFRKHEMCMRKAMGIKDGS